MLSQARTDTAWLGRPRSAGSTARTHRPSTTTAIAALVALVALWLPALAAGASSAIPDSGYVTNGEVNAIAHSGGITYIGGTFTEVGPATGPGVGINESTGADLGWARIWGGGGSISAVVSDGSGGYYIGGSFTEVAGHPAENLAHIKSNGEVDTGWLPKANGEVLALAVSGQTVYVGGSFTTIGTNNASRARIAALKASGVAGEGEATTWNPNATTGEVNALAVSGEVVYVGGTFTVIGTNSQTRNRIAAIKTNATAEAAAEATTWNPNATTGEVNALAVSGEVVYVGGTFTVVGTNSQTRNRIAAIKTNATAEAAAEATTWNPNATTGAVNALAVSGEVVYVGGTFTVVGTNSQTRHRIAAIKTNATAEAAAEATTWNPNATSGAVNALAVSGEVVYVGGTFTVVGTNSQTRHRIAAIKTNPTATAIAEATTWNPNADATVNALATSGSTVYAGGTFATMGATVRNRLAALNASNAPTTWNPNATTGEVNALAVSGEVVYVGGTFTVIGTNSQTRNRIAAIKTNATAEAAAEATTWNPNATTGAVNALAVSGEVVYVGGTFTVIGTNSQTRNRIAAIKTNATAEAAAEATTWNPNATTGAVNALAVSGEVVYVGGTFTVIGTNSQTRNRIAAIKTNATAEAAAEATTWNPNATTGAVNALAVSGEVVYVGGTFTVVGTNSQTRHRIAAIKTNATAEAAAEATTWNPNATSGAVNALVVSGEVVYAGGTFTVVGTNSQTRHRIAAIKTNPTATAIAEATTWNPNANNTVNALATSASGSKLYVGGVFTSLGTGDRSGYASFTIGGPTAAFSFSAGPYTAGVTTVTFTNESTDQTSSITAYAWTFGDTGTSISASPTHEYSAPCSPCTVTLKVTDAEGLSAEVSHAITVTEGTLTFFTTPPALPALPGVTLTGETQTTTATMNNFTVDYAKTGSGEGWNVTVSGHEETGLSPVFKQYCTEATCGTVGYVGGGFTLPANSLMLNSTGASFTALPGGTGGAPEVRCGSGECAVDAAQGSPVKVVSAAVGNGKGGWQTTGFGGTSLSLATPTNLHALPEHEAYRVDVIWTLNSGP